MDLASTTGHDADFRTAALPPDPVKAPGMGPSLSATSAAADRRTVLHLIHMTGPGGAETVVLNLVTGIQDEHWRSLVALPGWNWLGGALAERGVDPIIIPDGRRLPFLRDLVRTIRKERVDLLHTHLLGPASYGSLAALACGIPMVCTFHGQPDVTPDSLLETIRFALIRRAANKVVLVSDPLRTSLLRTGRIADEDAIVILNGVDTSAFEPRAESGLRAELGIAADAFLVGAVGNVRPAKDYPTFLRAAAALAERSSDYRFVIAGEAAGPLHAELLTLRDSLGLADRVTFAGFRSDVEQVMASFDALVLSSSSEGFSLVTIQAMASGVPVVATRCGGPEQIIEDEQDGLLVSVAAPAEIAAAVERLRHDQGLRSRLIRNALAKVRSSFSLERTLQAYTDLYTNILATGER